MTSAIDTQLHVSHIFDDFSKSDIHITTLKPENEDQPIDSVPQGVLLTNAEFRSRGMTDMITIQSEEQWEILKQAVDLAFKLKG